MLKLPKDVVADPRHEALLQLLTAHEAPLWEGGRNLVASLSMPDALRSELSRALAEGLASQGLELITTTLAQEQRGLDLAAAKAPEAPQNARASRILFLASDGSTRFYRDADALLTRYARRLLAIRLDLTGDDLGQRLLNRASLVRSVLVVDKKAAAKALLALLPPT